MSGSLGSQVAAALAAMDFPNGNDAPNSSGCPNGTGSAPLPCAAPGAAGCMPHLREPPTVRQAPPETLGDVVGRILRFQEPPDELGPYAVAYHIKHGIVAPTREWLANEPYVYLDADHNVRTSSVHRDYSHEMAPVLGEIALMLAPGANAAARGESLAPRGTGAFVEGAEGGAGLGKLAGRSIKVSEKGLTIVEQHLARPEFAGAPQNAAMIARLRSALSGGSRVTGADASFYLHEVSEATMMGRGLSYDAAHAAALGKYGVSPFSVYHPEVIQAHPGFFNSNWAAFWRIP
jgi:hypothetical protein